MEWWRYLLLVNIYLTLFYGFYALLLRRETFFQLNRMYLVGAALLSFVIPMIQSEWVQGLFITQQVQYVVYNSNAIVITAYEPIKNTYTLGELFLVLYIGGAIILTLKLMGQLLLLNKVINKPAPSAAYSFFKTIRMGEAVSDKGAILKHEQVHAQQWHSADVLIMEAVMIINWFNPVVYLYRFAIKHIHEFIADRQALKAGTNKADYALLLLSQTFDAPAHRLVNPFFNNSLLKQRIMMLQKNKSQRIKLVKYGLSAPLFILMLVLSSATISNSRTIKSINKKAEQVFLQPAASVMAEACTPAANNEVEPYTTTIATDTIPGDKGKVFTNVEESPKFPGGDAAFGQFLGKNIHYPKQARDKNVQGRVVLSFVVEKDGSLSDVTVIKSLGSGTDEEAVRVLKASPNWIPGKQNGVPVRTEYKLPINFALSEEKSIGSTTGNKNANEPVFSEVENAPSFPGGQEAFEKYLATTVKYPAKARDNKTEGKVLVTFIIEKDGSLTDAKVLRGIGNGADEEALRVLKASPKWKPGIQNGKPVNVQYTVPINFSLANNTPAVKTMGSLPPEKADPSGKKINAIVGTDNKSTFSTSPAGPRPLVILDDKESSLSAMSDIDPKNIESVTVLKEKAATDKYGYKGTNGVIIVKTKAKAK